MASRKGVSKRVLVVDDDYTTRRIIVQYLEDTGYKGKVLQFGDPEDIGDQIKACQIIVMDVRFGRERPTAGIDYIIEKIEEGSIDSLETTIIFKSIWGKDRPDVPERLQRIERCGQTYQWFDVKEGLELANLRQIIRSTQRT